MSNPEIELVADDSPNRCQKVTSQGQCHRKKTPHSKFCHWHLGGSMEKIHEKKEVEMFQITKWNDRLRQFKDHSQLKTLNNEIGLLRIMIEERINACQDATALMIASQSVGDLVMKVNALVVNAAKLDSQLNLTLTKAQVENFNQRILQILVDHVPPETLELIATEFETAMETL